MFERCCPGSACLSSVNRCGPCNNSRTLSVAHGPRSVRNCATPQRGRQWRPRGGARHLARNLLGTLCSRELAQAAKDIAVETRLEHRPVADGLRGAGIFRRSVMLASGRYVMLDDGKGVSLVPWRPVIEQRLGQRVAATMHDGRVSWELGVVMVWQFDKGLAAQPGIFPVSCLPSDGMRDGKQQGN